MSRCAFNNKGHIKTIRTIVFLKTAKPPDFDQNRSRASWYIHCPVPNAERIAHMSNATLDRVNEKPAGTTDQTLTGKLQSKLSNPVSTPEFDLHGTLDEVLNDVGLTAADSGGKLSFYG